MHIINSAIVCGFSRVHTRVALRVLHVSAFIYRDFITMFIIGVLHFTITPISTELLLVRYTNACLRLFVVILVECYALLANGRVRMQN